MTNADNRFTGALEKSIFLYSTKYGHPKTLRGGGGQGNGVKMPDLGNPGNFEKKENGIWKKGNTADENRS
jgi:hypothetical protein